MSQQVCSPGLLCGSSRTGVLLLSLCCAKQNKGHTERVSRSETLSKLKVPCRSNVPLSCAPYTMPPNAATKDWLRYLFWMKHGSATSIRMMSSPLHIAASYCSVDAAILSLPTRADKDKHEGWAAANTPSITEQRTRFARMMRILTNAGAGATLWRRGHQCPRSVWQLPPGMGKMCQRSRYLHAVPNLLQQI